jgi:hypothetical protein
VHLDSEGSKPKRGVDPAEVAARAIRLEAEPAADLDDLGEGIEALELLEPLEQVEQVEQTEQTEQAEVPPAAHAPGLTPPDLDPVP